MKLRKNEIISPKNFSFPHWTIQDFHGGIFRFPPPFDFFHRDVDEVVRYNASALPVLRRESKSSFIHLQYYEEVWAMPFFANFADV